MWYSTVTTTVWTSIQVFISPAAASRLTYLSLLRPQALSILHSSYMLPNEFLFTVRLFTMCCPLSPSPILRLDLPRTEQFWHEVSRQIEICGLIWHIHDSPAHKNLFCTEKAATCKILRRWILATLTPILPALTMTKPLSIRQNFVLRTLLAMSFTRETTKAGVSTYKHAD